MNLDAHKPCSTHPGVVSCRRTHLWEYLACATSEKLGPGSELANQTSIHCKNNNNKIKSTWSTAPDNWQALFFQLGFNLTPFGMPSSRRMCLCFSNLTFRFQKWSPETELDTYLKIHEGLAYRSHRKYYDILEKVGFHRFCKALSRL